MIHQAYAENLELKEKNKTENQVIFEITLNYDPELTDNNAKALSPVHAFGFDIAYNSAVLSFQSYEKGALIKNRYETFEVMPVSSGILRAGGFEFDKDHKIQTGESGVLLLLTFSIESSGNYDIVIQDLDDLFEGLSVKNITQETPPEYDDVNKDGKVGLAEVIHLLQMLTRISN